MRSNQWKLWAAAAAASLGLAYFGALQFATAQVPPPGDRSSTRDSRTVSGRVSELLRNDHDDIDGFSLDGGAEIHFPPHIGRTVAAKVQVGDRVEVQGRDEVRPRGERVFEAFRITSGETMINVDPPEGPRGPAGKRGPGGPRGPREDEPMNAKGKVTSYATNPDGDVDGLILADGTEVKFPPHQSEELQRVVSKGDEVRVAGRKHETPEGDTHLHADRVTDSSTGKSLDRDEPRGGPRDRRPPPAGKRGPAAERGPGRGPGPEADRPEPPHEEILRELREIRKLIEAQSRR